MHENKIYSRIQLIFIFFTFSLFVVFQSCSNQPQLDCSSIDGYMKSIEDIKVGMSEEEKIKFDAAWFVATMSSMGQFARKNKDPQGDPEAMALEMMKDYCGLTANQIIKKIENIK